MSRDIDVNIETKLHKYKAVYSTVNRTFGNKLSRDTKLNRMKYRERQYCCMAVNVECYLGQVKTPDNSHVIFEAGERGGRTHERYKDAQYDYRISDVYDINGTTEQN